MNTEFLSGNMKSFGKNQGVCSRIILKWLLKTKRNLLIFQCDIRRRGKDKNSPVHVMKCGEEWRCICTYFFPCSKW
jgi:hypothetical protein